MTKHNYTPIQLPLPLADSSYELSMTKGQIALLDAIDGDLLMYRWNLIGDHRHYVAVRIVRDSGKPKSIAMHREILSRMLGRPLEPSELCDHKNGNSLDNRRLNLRVANESQNNANAKLRANSKTGFKGVTKLGDKYKNRYKAVIYFNHKQYYLGVHATPEAAHEAYCKAAAQLHGEFARAA